MITHLHATIKIYLKKDKILKPNKQFSTTRERPHCGFPPPHVRPFRNCPPAPVPAVAASQSPCS